MRSYKFIVACLLTCVAAFAGAFMPAAVAAQATSGLTAIYVAATGVSSTDNSALQGAFDKCSTTSRPLILDATSKSFVVTTPLYVKPQGSDTQVGNLRVVAYSKNGNPTILYSGSGPCLTLRGVKRSYFGFIKIRTSATGSTAWNISTKDTYQSTSALQLDSCHAELYGNNTTGFAVGAEDGGAADVSSIRFTNCIVAGDRTHTGMIGWSNHAGNTLNNYWDNCSVNYIATGWSFWPDSNYTPNSGGGSASTIINSGGSYVDTMVKMQGGFSVNVYGGRSEICGLSGSGVFYVGDGGGTVGGLNIYGHVIGGIATGSSFGYGGSQTPINAHHCTGTPTGGSAVNIDGFYTHATLTPW